MMLSNTISNWVGVRMTILTQKGIGIMQAPVFTFVGCASVCYDVSKVAGRNIV